MPTSAVRCYMRDDVRNVLFILFYHVFVTAGKKCCVLGARRGGSDSFWLPTRLYLR
jgi:hypothetical protein